MRTGCGVTTKNIRGRPYLYFWHFEDRGGRRRQVFQYLGSARSEAARQRLVESVDAYYERILAEVRRRRSEILAKATTA